MKNYFLTLFLGLMVSCMFGQSSQRLNQKLIKESEFSIIQRDITADLSTISKINENPPQIPLGTTTEDIVTGTKIGESSNAHYFLLDNDQISIVNNASSVAFIYHENLIQCGGSNGGNLRYSISTDGGQIWDTGPSNCYGLGPINPFYSNSGRYPNVALFVPPGEPAIPENLNLIYSTSGVSPGPGTLGSHFGLVSNVADSPIVEHELVPFWGGSQYFPYSLTERVPGEYWTAAWSNVGGSPGNDIFLNKGIYDSSANEVNWQVVAVLSPDFNLSFDGDPVHAGDISVAFSPDGTTGYVAILSDLNGSQDSVFAPCFAASTNGGLSWDNFEEFDFTQYANFGLMDSIVHVTDMDTVNNIPINAGAYPTTAFDFDLTVDKHGNPHLVAVVGAGSHSLGNGTYTPPQYTLFTGLGMAIFDFTKDTNGAWNMINLSRQSTFRGEFGDIVAGGSEAYTADPWMQASRSSDGSKVFVSWTDTDSTGGKFGNDEPDFITIGIDVDNYQVSPVVNWTHDDATWAGRALIPKISPVSFDDGAGMYNIPTVIMDFGPPGTSILNVTSYYYFSDIGIHDSSFNQSVSFFSNCQTNPLSSVLTIEDPDCGLANGKAWVTASGGFGTSYSYQWNPSGGVTDTASALTPGVYSVTITDSLGCMEEKQFVLNNANAAAVTVSQVQNVSCNGLSDGMINVSLAGGASPFSFIWSNGSLSQNLTGIPAGTYSLTVTDNNNCLSFISATITEPTDFDLTGAAQDVTCGDGIDGKIVLNAIGSTGPYSFLWNNGSTAQFLNNLIAGTYNVTVTDINGCSKMDSFVVNQPSVMILSSSTSPDDGTNNGLATISATGGTPPYTYSWSNGSTVPVVSGLAAGTYSVTVTDALNCEKVDTVEVASTVSIDDLFGLGINEMKLYPNPAKEATNLSISLEDFEKPEIRLFDLRGRTILKLEANQVSQEHQFTIPLRDLSEGVYFLSVKTSKGKVVKRFIKTN